MARYDLRKRHRPPISENPVAEVNGKSSKKKIKLASRDPFKYLNLDIIEILLPYLSGVDLARSEGVSRLWRDLVKDFSARLGTRLLFPHLRNPEDSHIKAKDLQYEEFKKIARYHHNISTGKPSSFFSFYFVFFFLCRGKFVVWTRYGPTGRRGQAHWRQVHWRSLERLEDGSVPEPKTFPISQFSITDTRLESNDADQDPLVAVHDIDMNQDGLLLLQLNSNQDRVRSWDFRSGRDIIYSPVTGKVFWSKIYCHVSRTPPDFIPLLLGKDWVYGARIVQSRSDTNPRDEYVLAACDFRTDKEIYRSSALRFYGPTVSADSRRIKYIRLLQTNDGGDIIVNQPSPDVDGDVRVSVVNASNGHLIQIVDPPLVDLTYISTHPGASFSSAMSSTWTPEQKDGPYGCPAALKGYQITIMERFSRQMADFFSPLPSYIILTPSEGDGIGVFGPPSVHPAALGAFAYSRASRKDNWDVSAHSFVLTGDRKLREAVEAELERIFPIEDMFLVTGEEMVTLPQQQDGQRKNTEFKLSRSRFSSKYTDDGLVVLCRRDSKDVLVFD